MASASLNDLNSNSKIHTPLKPKLLSRYRTFGSSQCGSVVMSLTSNHENVGLIPGLDQWVKDPVLPWAVCRSQMRLRSCIAMAVSNLTPRLGNSICCRYAPKKKKKKKRYRTLLSSLRVYLLIPTPMHSRENHYSDFFHHRLVMTVQRFPLNRIRQVCICERLLSISIILPISFLGYLQLCSWVRCKFSFLNCPFSGFSINIIPSLPTWSLPFAQWLIQWLLHSDYGKIYE